MSAYYPRYDSSYALLIGIDKYIDPGFVPLGNAQQDALILARVLSAPPHNFTVVTLIGVAATRAAILDALFDLRETIPNDRILVYFAGHGYTLVDRFGAETGHLAAADTIPARDFTALAMEEVTALRRHTAAKHIAFIFDACFSGQALGLTRMGTQAAELFLLRRAYQVLSAGAGDQTVSDFSSMTSTMIESLTSTSGSRPLTINELGLHLQQEIAMKSGQLQIPQFGHLSGSQGGDFILSLEAVQHAVPRYLKATEQGDISVDTTMPEWPPGDARARPRGVPGWMIGAGVVGILMMIGLILTTVLLINPPFRTAGTPAGMETEAAGEVTEVPFTIEPIQSATDSPIEETVEPIVATETEEPTATSTPTKVPTPRPTPTAEPEILTSDNIASLEPLQILSEIPFGLAQGADSAALSPVGTQIATPGLDGEVVIWDVTTGEVDHVLRSSGDRMQSVRWSPDGQYIAAGDGIWTRIWRVNEEQPITQFENEGLHIEWSPDSTAVVACSGSQAVEVFSLAESRVVATLSSVGTDVDWVENLITVGLGSAIVVFESNSWDQVSVHRSAHFRAAIRPDGKITASSGGQNTVLLWNTLTGSLTEQITAPNSERPSELGWLPDSRVLLIATRGGTLGAWDTAARSYLLNERAHSEYITDLTLSEDGTRIATASDDGTVLVWGIP